MRARGGRAGRRCSRSRGVRQDALRDPVSPSRSLPPLASLGAANLQVCFVSLAQSWFFFPWSARACAGAGRSRGRCGGWPAAAGGGPAPRRPRGAATRRRRRRHRSAAPGLVLVFLMITEPFLNFSCARASAIFQYPYNFCAIWVHQSSLDDFLSKKLAIICLVHPVLHRAG